MYAKVFEHYSGCAVYGQQARDLISQAIADLVKNLSQATLSNFVDPR
jgi:sarcosine oxidase delta subunit